MLLELVGPNFTFYFPYYFFCSLFFYPKFLFPKPMIFFFFSVGYFSVLCLNLLTR